MWVPGRSCAASPWHSTMGPPPSRAFPHGHLPISSAGALRDYPLLWNSSSQPLAVLGPGDTCLASMSPQGAVLRPLPKRPLPLSNSQRQAKQSLPHPGSFSPGFAAGGPTQSPCRAESLSYWPVPSFHLLRPHSVTSSRTSPAPPPQPLLGRHSHLHSARGLPGHPRSSWMSTAPEQGTLLELLLSAAAPDPWEGLQRHGLWE